MIHDTLLASATKHDLRKAILQRVCLMREANAGEIIANTKAGHSKYLAGKASAYRDIISYIESLEIQ